MGNVIDPYWFSTTPTTSTIYNYNSGGIDYGPLYSGAIIRYGQKIDSGNAGIGSYVKKIKFKLFKSGSPTGTCRGKAYAGDGTSVLGTTETLDVSTLDTTSTMYEFTFDNYVLVETDSRFVIEYSGGDASNFIKFEIGAVGGAGANTTQTEYAVSWANGTTRDCLMIFDSAPV